MTIPGLIASYRKNVVEVRLKKFYSVMNQAVKLSEVDNGELSTWEAMPLYNATETDVQEWWDKYFGTYLNTIKVEIKPSSRNASMQSIVAYFPDGSAMDIFPGSTVFSPEAKNIDTAWKNLGTLGFLFTVIPNKVYGEGFTDEQIKEGFVDENENGYNYGAHLCDGVKDGGFCTAVIQRNGWKIPDDYPYSF